MLLDTITLVLRETLEAGTLLAILLSMSFSQQARRDWVWPSIAIGSMLAFLYSQNFATITEWQEYRGQELLNAVMLVATSIGLLILVGQKIMNKYLRGTLNRLILSVIVIFLLTRELTEMVIFYTGLMQLNDSLVSGITSGFVGLTIGTSTGVLLYVVLNNLPARWASRIQISFLSLISAGMAVQAIQLLMQVDLINSAAPVWNTNSVINEASIMGQLVYAVFGYEATPTLTEVLAYASVLFVVLILWCASTWKDHHANT